MRAITVLLLLTGLFSLGGRTGGQDIAQAQAEFNRAMAAQDLPAMARAFLYAGAHALLASHWRVSDEATAVLTVETQREDVTQTRAVALQRAMRAVRTGKRGDGSAVPGWTRDWAHPMMWAPFSLISTVDE